ncbi:MAG: YggS family pyridoxal phosphate-dependent enzyme [Cytophagales bacterium]|nr:YggS family pyridoxal phosphate-dependent enzyme [Cytophagales bacterium]
MSIPDNIRLIENELIGTPCKLIAVTKTKPVSDLMEAYHAGCRRFGENKVQEMVDKYDQLPKDIEWHMIGHLQSNKVKYMASFVHLIHGVDSLDLLKEINKRAAQHERVIECLLQVYIAQEDTKFGLDYHEVMEILGSSEFQLLNNIKIVGLMGMASNTEDMGLVRQEFRKLKMFFDQLKGQVSLPNVEIKELSMGMSGDYEIAIEEGSTMIRVGSKIFGERNYSVSQ